MGRKRPRPSSSAQLLAAATFAITPTSQGFILFAPLCHGPFHGHHLTTRSTRHHQCRPSAPAAAAQALRAIPHGRRKPISRDSEDDDDPNDPLPRTMEELYRRMRKDPPVDRRSQYKMVLQPEELEFMEQAVRDVFAPTQDDSWWEENGEDWDWMANNPGASFVIGVEQAEDDDSFVWGMQDYFRQETADSERPDGNAARFSLSAYKAGTTTSAGSLENEDLLERTPFAQYWDSVPDLGVTKRVYAFNAVDRMAALKFMMNCTYNGMHGSAENRQAGHFLWGYADQLDWMRRSGRLSSKPGSIKVDRASWWGRVSYALTIVPLAAAVESGLWEEDAVSILDGDDLQLPEMRRAVRAWRRVWCFNDADIATRVLMDMPVHDSLQERVRRAQWAAHLESLDAVEALYWKEFDALPSSAEREFARGWCRAARLFALAAAHTNLNRLLLPLGAGYPPERVLADNDDTDDFIKESRESVPYEPPYIVAEAEADSLVALNTRRCVESVRWLGRLRAPMFAILRTVWRRACISYPARRQAARVLRQACYGGKKAKAAAVGQSFLFMFVPNLNYRKLTPPFGVDPAEAVEYDPDMEPRDPTKAPPRPAGSRPLNPLQWPWYDGRRPDPSTGGPDEDDDGLAGSAEGMFPRRMAPPDISFERLQAIEREIAQDLRRAKKRLLERENLERNSEERGGGGTGSRHSARDAKQPEGKLGGEVGGDSATSTVFM